MSQSPEIQRKAQAELDSQVGPGCLPEYDDKDILPYTYATYLETLRSAPVTPLGLPHKVIEDDVYNGFFIPKGATVVPVSVGYFILRVLFCSDDYVARRISGIHCRS